MSAWADLDLSAIVEQVARVVWDQQKPPEIAWDRVNEITRHNAREAVLPFVVAARDALTGDVEAMLDRARAEATTATPALVDRLAEAAFVSDDLGGHHKPGPMLRPHTWQSIPEEGRENYRRLIRDVLATLADAHRAGVCDCTSLGACFPTCSARIDGGAWRHDR